MLARMLSAFFASLPALGFILLVALFSYGEYYFVPYMTAGAVFLVASLGLGAGLPGVEQLQWWARAARIGLAQILAYLAAILVLGVLNATPLCVGQNNGDGQNSFGMCLAQSVMVGALYFVPLLSTMISMIMRGCKVFSGTPLLPSTA